MQRKEIAALLIGERIKFSPDLVDLLKGDHAQLLRVGLDQWAADLVEKIVGPELVYRVHVASLKTDKIIAAIKALRSEDSTLGLKDAKDISERLRDAPAEGNHVILFPHDLLGAQHAVARLTEAGFYAYLQDHKAT